MGDFSYSITQISPQRQDASTSSGVAASAVTNGYYSNGSNLSSPSGQHRTQHETYGMFSQYHQQPENRASPKRRVSNASMAVRTAHLGPEYTPQELAGTDPAHRMGVIQESSDPSSQSRAAYRPFYPHSAIADASSDSTHAQRPHDGEQYPDWHAQRPPQSSSGQVPIWSYSVNHHSRNTSGGTIHPQAIHLSNPSQLAPQGLLANGLSTYPSYNVSNTRPMTAPSSSVMPQTNYYHASHTGGMFPPSAYSFAGFPHALSGRYILPPAQLAAPPGPLALLGDAIGPTTYLEGGKLISGPRPYSSSNFPERPGAVAQHAQQRPPGSSGGPTDDHYGPAPPGSSGGMFSHHPPPLASNSGHVNPIQYPHTMPAPPTSSHGQPNSYGPGLTTSASHPRPTGQVMPDNYLPTHAAQEILNAAQMQMHVRQQLGSSHGLHPDTAATARPDTAVSTYSTGGPVYEVRGGGVSEVALLGGAPAPPVGRPTSSHGTIQPTRGKAPVAAEASTSGATQQYDIVPLPSHPKKRPRRRFEEIERIYDCSYPGCPKAYGTLNHLNAHVSMQKHGPKRLPAEFKEVRKAWRLRQKAKQAARDAARKAGKLVDEDEEDDGMDDPSEDHPSAEAEDSGNVKFSPAKPVTPPAHREASLPNATANYTNGSAESAGSLNSIFDYVPPFLQPSQSPTNHTRPSTAPSHIVNYNIDSLTSATGVPLISIIGGNGQYTQGYGPAYSQRKGSLTSLQPSFESIQEEDDISQAQGNVGEAALEFSKAYAEQWDRKSAKTPEGAKKYASVVVPVTRYSPGNEFLGAAAAPTPSYPGGVMSFAAFLNSPSDASSARPSTAPSPFRFTASAFTATAGLDSLSSAYDMLDKAGSFGATPVEETQEDLSRSWSPEWRALTQHSAIKHEVH